MGLVAACALATGWMRNKVNSAPDHLRETASFWELVRHKSPPPLNREQRRARARAMVTAFMAEFPVLAVEARPVPPEVNGFLKLHELERSGLKIGPELETLLESGEASPDPETAWRLLEENAAWVAEIERIAAMEQRSSSNLPEDDVEHFPKALGFGGRMLLLKAWLAAMAGDEAAFQLLELGRGGMETSTALAAVPVDPVTGAPFHFDAGTRSLSVAANSQDRYDWVELPW